MDHGKEIKYHRDMVLADIEDRIDVHKEAMVHRRGGLAAPNSLNILAIGDSWFDYPLYKDVVGWVRDGLGSQTDILSLAHYGDATTNMLGATKRERLIRVLSDPEHGQFDAILVSGGGNDIAGDQFCFWVKDFNDANQFDRNTWINRFAYEAALVIVMEAYSSLNQIRDAYAPGATIFTHSYDYPWPSGRGVCGLGPWLQPSLGIRGWREPEQGAEIARMALQAFDARLSLRSRVMGGLIHVETQGTLDQQTDWANELHPTEAGFKKIADKFVAAIEKEFFGGTKSNRNS